MLKLFLDLVMIYEKTMGALVIPKAVCCKLSHTYLHFLFVLS